MPAPNKPLPQRVLVAEDEHLIAAGIAAGLRSLGCSVIGPAPDGQAAIEAAETEPPDMAVLDIRMPGVDGLTAARQLWEDHGVPSIIVTAFSDDQYVSRAQATGVFGYVLKPVSIENLRVTLNVAWARANEAEALTTRLKQAEQSLVNRRVVEQAKWKLIEMLKITEAEAHARLQQAARDKRRKIIEVANDVLAGRPWN